ncbi:hypothetical protein pb186bvf_007813 [Paramecium bursaria]
MSYKPRKAPEQKGEITKEIKPNLIPSNIAQGQQRQQIFFNTRGYYQDLGLRIHGQRQQLVEILDRSNKILEEEQQKLSYQGIF